MKKSFVMSGLLIIFAAIGQAGATPYIAYNVPVSTMGNQDFTGLTTLSLGESFTVNQAIQVTALGVFDSGGDGFTGTLAAQLWDVTGTTKYAESTFTSGNPGVFESGSGMRFQNISPVTLTPGSSYMIVAFDFTLTDPNGNLYYDALFPLTTNDGGGALTFGENYYNYLTPGGFPDVPDTLSAGYAAGTFKYDVIAEPSTLLLLGIGLIGLAGLGRRKFLK